MILCIWENKGSGMSMCCKINIVKRFLAAKSQTEVYGTMSFLLQYDFLSHQTHVTKT